MGSTRWTSLGSILVPAALLAGACTGEKRVYREPVSPPPDPNAGFLGYFTSSDKSTTCGNCHSIHEADRRPTAHSNAYSLLAGNPAATPEGFTCHTVSDKGNATAAPAGWDAVEDTA